MFSFVIVGSVFIVGTHHHLVSPVQHVLVSGKRMWMNKCVYTCVYKTVELGLLQSVY